MCVGGVGDVHVAQDTSSPSPDKIPDTSTEGCVWLWNYVRLGCDTAPVVWWAGVSKARKVHLVGELFLFYGRAACVR